MIPPGFVRFYDEKGPNRPHCRECIHYANEKFTIRGICWEYGAYVSLYSSCQTFERRVGSDTPIVDEAVTKASHRFGLIDLVK